MITESDGDLNCLLILIGFYFSYRWYEFISLVLRYDIEQGLIEFILIDHSDMESSGSGSHIQAICCSKAFSDGS